MKKKIIIGLGVILLFILLVSSLSKNSQVKESFEQGKNQARQELNEAQLFSKDEAKKKVQEYKTTVELESPKIPTGTTLLEVYNIRSKIPAIQNNGWFVEETEEKGKFIVGFRQVVSDNLPFEPRWEVTKDSIKALNGKAITITPEFGPKENGPLGNDFEKQVLEYSKNLYNKYEKELNDSYEAEKRATKETATYFKVSEDEVEDIVNRLLQ